MASALVSTNARVQAYLTSPTEASTTVIALHVYYLLALECYRRRIRAVHVARSSFRYVGSWYMTERSPKLTGAAPIFFPRRKTRHLRNNSTASNGTSQARHSQATKVSRNLLCNIPFACMHHLPYCTNKVPRGETIPFSKTTLNPRR